MKAFRIAVLGIVIVAFQTSCMSLDMIAHAEGKAPPTDPNGRPYDPQPAYYALVPLVLPLDLISLPIQYFYFQSDRAQAARPGPPPGQYPPPGPYPPPSQY